MRTITQTIGWGVFCACSWTWCIGMFLPIVMIDQFGWWGFAVFALPNVIGCAMFGYIVRNRDRSLYMIEKHRLAMLVFSWITIAYHMFFTTAVVMFFFSPPVVSNIALAIAAPVALLIGGAAFSLVPLRTWPAIAVITYAVSIFCMIMIGFDHVEIQARPDAALTRLAWLAPTIAFGFLLCPYLDLTFHRALQQSPSRHAFAVFGITFAIMIVFTCFYATLNQPRLLWFVIVHLFAQSLFTIAVHIREMRVISQSTRVPTAVVRLIPLAVIAVPTAFIALLFANEYDAAVDVYLRWLVFYGLVFPMYVLLFIGPRRTLSMAPRNVGIFIAIVLLSMPLYEIAYIHQPAWVVAIPMMFVAGWLMLPQRRFDDSATLRPT